jgi:cyclopropane fatty-acyl-phospholipid synthase-like methyltransferase
MQYKLFRDSFQKRGLDIKSDLVPLDVRDMTTDDAFDKVAIALKEHGYDVL